MSSIRRRVACAAALVLLPAVARAEPAASHAAAFQAVLDCRGIADAAKRLACYDAAAGRMATAETTGEIVVIDKEQARAAHRQAFGLTLPSLDFITRGLSHEELDRVEGVVKAASADASGRWTVVLDDGAVWRQISNDVLSRDPRPGSKVLIRRATLGSFMMKIDGQPGIRVHRDE
jgi:hypothetical protein